MSKAVAADEIVDDITEFTPTQNKKNADDIVTTPPCSPIQTKPKRKRFGPELPHGTDTPIQPSGVVKRLRFNEKGPEPLVGLAKAFGEIFTHMVWMNEGHCSGLVTLNADTNTIEFDIAKHNCHPCDHQDTSDSDSD